MAVKANNHFSCHAGDLVYKRGLRYNCAPKGDKSHTNLRFFRSFEYLSASGPLQVTELPGSTSFTSALIHSLQALKKEKGCFTTSELRDKIDTHKDFPTEQHPVLADRDENMYTGRIMLYALPGPGQRLEDSPTFIEPSIAELGQEVTLHLLFKGNPSNRDIE